VTDDRRSGTATASSSKKKADAPDPDDPRKPEGPDDLSKPSWKYVLRKTMREFSSDQCTDLAAALTYYGVLALFPALLALISLLGLVGQSERVVDTLLNLLSDVGPADAADTLAPVLENLTNAPAAGLALVTGLLGALWSASGYVGAFSRAMNRMYEVEEGRPFWKLRPTMLVVTIISVLLVGIALTILVVSGPVARSVGNLIGAGGAAVTIWSIVKWPVLALVVVLVVAILYYATPNVQQPKFAWMSVGALVAIVVWLLASVLFGFYVSNFSSYDATYGSLAGVIVFLLWLWITNLALLFGAELDAELERGRQLQAGIKAEDELQLPPRDTRTSDKKAAKEQEDVERGATLRRSRGKQDSA
jgi:membrane protein